VNKNILKWFWIFPAVAALCLIAAMLNPSIVYYSETFAFACMDAAVEAIILVVVLSILRKLNMFASWKLIAFYVVVVAGSLAMSSLLTSIEMHAEGPQQTNFFLFSTLSVFMILFFLNFGLLAITVDISFWKSCLTSTIMSLINTFLVLSAVTYCH
jgi:hypothetical protein